MVSLVRKLEQSALEKYSECPKYVTIINHADKVDDSEFHCVYSFNGPKLPASKLGVRNFIVPGQELINFEDEDYGKFTVVRVFETEEGPEYWLIVSVQSRMGFIIPFNMLPESLLANESCT